MSAAALLAGLAGAMAAVGLVETAAARPRSPRRRRRAAVAALARAGRGVGLRAPRGLAERISAAGLDARPADVVAIKAALAIAAAVAALPAASAAPGRLGLALLAGAPAAAFLAPDAWLQRRTRLRRRVMEAELPEVLDLLRVAVAAGLPPRRALAEVGRRHPGLLAAEFRRAAGQAALGVPATESLRRLAARAPADGVPAVAQALRRAEAHGAPLARTLAAQAAEARALRAQRMAEAAAKAAPKIQLVVALLLVPSVLLLVAAAALPAVLR